MKTPPVLVSACLAGLPARYDGAVQAHPAVSALVDAGLAIPVCPEQIGGLPTPREACERLGGRVFAKSGADVTEQFRRGAEAVVELARRTGCTTAVLKARSPSCGSGRVYDGSFTGRLIDGDGMLAELLRAEGVTVYSEETYPPPETL